MFKRSSYTNFETDKVVDKLKTPSPLAVKVLLIGIDYRGTSYELGGCENDVLDMRKQILSDYPNAKITLMTDNTPMKPTRDNILNQLKELVASATSGDTLLFHYSGHGSQVQDYDGNEEDGMDETICPINFVERRKVTINGVTRIMDSQIIDDEIHQIISGIPKGVKFLMVFDSCHSGTIGDLKNDFAHYHGPNEWQDDNVTSGQVPLPPSGSGSGSGSSSSSGSGSESVPVPEPVPVPVPLPVPDSGINCNTGWVYVNFLKELWITPMDNSLYQKLAGKQFVAKTSNLSKVPAQLVNNPNRVVMINSNFKKLTNGQYQISCAELGINNLIVNLPRVVMPTTYSSREIVSRSYNPRTGKHSHFHRDLGQKRTFSLRAVAGCFGGELRIIAGCQENQTSVGTSQNGACTNAILETIGSLQGLSNFCEKIFSHNLLDIKFVEDTINHNLSKFGYTQHSVVSWGHATGQGVRVLPSWQSFSGNIEFNNRNLQEPQKPLVQYPTYAPFFKM